MVGLFDLKTAVQARAHIDFLEEYQHKTHKSGLIEGAKCDAFKKKDK